MSRRQPISAALSKRVAHSQKWACATCRDMLPSAYQIDHIVALADGGADAKHNMQALCANCHADKTQREHLQRIQRHQSVEKTHAYEERTDWYKGETAVCAECKLSRPINQSHPVCWAIEQRFHNYLSAVSVSLERFRFAQRGTSRFGASFHGSGRFATQTEQTKYELPAARSGELASQDKQSDRSIF